MTLPPELILRPGNMITGERLRQLFRYRDPLPMPTGPVPVWSRMNTVHSSSGQSLAHVGRQIIPSGKITFARIADINTVITERVWRYDLVRVRPNNSFGFEDVTSAPLIENARNIVEVNNTAGSTIVGYGHDIQDSANVSITLLPIRLDSIVPIQKMSEPDGGIVWWFIADNPIQVECV